MNTTPAASVTIVEVGRFPPAYLRELVRWSYGYALARLPLKQRRSIPVNAA